MVNIGDTARRTSDPATPARHPLQLDLVQHHVLVEHADGATREVMAAALRRAGFEVSVCAGPASFRGGRCSLVVDGACHVVEHPDAVVCGLDLDAGETRAVLAAHRKQSVGDAVIVEATATKAAAHADAIEGLRRLPFPCSWDTLVEAVREAVDAT